jgi:hypothetical protein
VQVTKGHEFEYIGKDEYGYILKDGDVVLHIHNKSMFTLKVSYEQAVTEINYSEEQYYFKNYLRNHCTHKDTGYYDHDTYDSCNLIESNYDDDCFPSTKCVQYVKLDNRCLKHLRKLKLNELDEKE